MKNIGHFVLDRTYQRKYEHASLRDLEDFLRSANQLTRAVIVGRELLHGVDILNVKNKTSLFSALECIHHAVFKRRAVDSKDATFGNQGRYMSWSSTESFTKTGKVKKNSTLANVKLGMQVLLKADFTCDN